MKKYALESAEVGGRVYGSCFLYLDEQAQAGKVTVLGGAVRKKESDLATVKSGPGTPVEVSGRRVKIGGLSLVAMDERSASEIGAVLLPRTAAPPSSATALKLYDVASELLLGRARAIDLLVRYRASPRGVRFELGDAWSAGEEGPVEEYLAKVRKELSTSLDNIKPLSAEHAGSPAAAQIEKVCAFVYAVGKMQDSMLDEASQKGAELLLAELGVEAAGVKNAGVGELTSTLLSRGKNVLLR